jgi:hypothetical protein
MADCSPAWRRQFAEGDRPTRVYMEFRRTAELITYDLEKFGMYTAVIDDADHVHHVALDQIPGLK